MAQANVFYKGEEKKFAIVITAAGFSMDADDFDIEVTNDKESFLVQKIGDVSQIQTDRWANENESLVVFYEEGTVTVPPAEEGGESTTEIVNNWFAIIDTQYFNSTGALSVIATAHIKDTKASGSVRNSIDRAALGTLKNK